MKSFVMNPGAPVLREGIRGEESALFFDTHQPVSPTHINLPIHNSRATARSYEKKTK